MLVCGKMKSQVPAIEGYCAFASGEIETQSVSHNAAILFTSARVKVMLVVALARRIAAHAKTRSAINLRGWGDIERRG